MNQHQLNSLITTYLCTEKESKLKDIKRVNLLEFQFFLYQEMQGLINKV